MVNFTSNTYQMKREILSFSNKISRQLSKPDRKFSADMTYGMLASNSCLLTDVKYSIIFIFLISPCFCMSIYALF